jgi:hypothetical protein
MLDQDDDSDYTTDDLLRDLRKSLERAERDAQDLADELKRINATLAALRKRLRENAPRPRSQL